MKIKVEVDLSDFYPEEESGSFNDQIKDFIAYKVKQDVFEEFKTKGFQMVADMSRKLVDSNLDAELKSITRQMVNGRKLSNGKTFKQMIVEKLESSYLNVATINDAISRRFKEVEIKINQDIEKKSIDLAKELKDRYDLLFASQIVAKMNEQGLLKEGVAELLLKK